MLSNNTDDLKNSTPVQSDAEMKAQLQEQISAFESGAIDASGTAPSPSAQSSKTDQATLSKKTTNFSWKSMSLRVKTTILAIVLGTAPVLAVGGGAVYLANITTTERIENTKKFEAKEIAQLVNSFLYERFSDIQAVANLPSLSNPKVIKDLSQEEKSDILTSYANTYGIYDSIAAFDLNGNVMAQSQGPKLENPANRDYFREVLKTGDRVVSTPQISPESGKYTLYYATPLKDPNGKMFGVVRTSMPLDEGLKELLATFNIDGQEYYLLGPTMKVIYSSQEDAIDKNGTDVFQGLVSLSAPGDVESRVIWNLLSKSEQMLGKTYIDNYRDMPNLNWHIITTLPSNLAYAEQRQLVLSLLFGTAVASIVVAWVASYLAKELTNPIQKAAQAVTQLGQGELDVRLDIKGEDELAALGKNINVMASELEQLIETQKAESERIELARQEARAEADKIASEQRQAKEALQKRALELLMEVDPVSKGDLTIRATVTPDEIGTVADSYNAIIRNLRGIVTQVQDAVGAVNTTTQSNEVAVRQVAKEATEQVNAIAIALKQIEEMTTTSEGVTERARLAEEQVAVANQAVTEGDEAMNRTVAGINSIRDTVSDTAKKVKRLGEASQKISKVVNLISGFAAQTNLLALNAAIEAAKAGEEGRGFSVVAEEVRALAQQSAEATADIEKLVEEIQAQTNEVVVAMENGTEQVVAGTQLVEESREKLNKIATVSNQVNSLIQEISEAAAAQTQVSSTVSHTMKNVADIASETSEQSESVAKSFSQLIEVAQKLQVNVAQFKLS